MDEKPSMPALQL